MCHQRPRHRPLCFERPSNKRRSQQWTAQRVPATRRVSLFPHVLPCFHSFSHLVASRWYEPPTNWRRKLEFGAKIQKSTNSPCDETDALRSLEPQMRSVIWASDERRRPPPPPTPGPVDPGGDVSLTVLRSNCKQTHERSQRAFENGAQRTSHAHSLNRFERASGTRDDAQFAASGFRRAGLAYQRAARPRHSNQTAPGSIHPGGRIASITSCQLKSVPREGECPRKVNYKQKNNQKQNGRRAVAQLDGAE